MKKSMTLIAALLVAVALPATAALAGGERRDDATTFVSLDELGELVERSIVPAWRAELSAEMRTWPGKALRDLLERGEPVRVGKAPATGTAAPAGASTTRSAPCKAVIVTSSADECEAS